MGAELITGYDAAYTPVAALTVPAMRSYAERHGMAFSVSPLESDQRAPSWSKIPAMKAALDRGSDPVIWLDADCLIVRPETDIRAGLDPDKQFFLRMAQTPQGMWGNAGVVVVRNSSWSRSFLDAIWNNQLVPEHAFWEQAAMLDLVGFRAVLNRGSQDVPNLELLRHIGGLDARWNEIVNRDVPLTIPPAKQPFIRHYAGVPSPCRSALIARDIGLRNGDALMPILTTACIKLHFFQLRMSRKAALARGRPARLFYAGRLAIASVIGAALFGLAAQSGP